jgi:DNA mismatch repair protein MutS
MLNKLLKKYKLFNNKINEMNEDLDNEEIKKIMDTFFDFDINKIKLINIYKDLEIFTDREGNENNSILEKIKYTQTKFGEWQLKKELIDYNQSKETIEKKQQILNKLLENDNDFNFILENLKEIKSVENDIFWLFKEHNKETTSYFEMVYFKGIIVEHLNKNELFLKYYNLFQIIISPAMNILLPIIVTIIPLIFMYLFQSESFKKYKDNLVESLKNLNINFQENSCSNSNNDVVFKFTQYLSFFAWILFYIHSVYSNLKIAFNTNKIINIIHKRLNNIALFIKKAHLINEKYYSLFNETLIDKKCIHLWSETFNQSPHLLSNKGKILITYKELIKKKECLKEIITFIGKIDYNIGLCLLYKKHINTKNKFCFPFLRVSSTPIFKTNKLWHPYLNPNLSISNDLNLGDKNNNNAIITGPNAGGKSTFIKSIALSILFAQTLGISNCSNLEFTVFKNIETYLNIPDLKGKESLFEAEINRAYKYIETIKNLNKNEFSLIIMDEIFNSTNPEEGIAGAYSICKKLSNFTNNISIITTHFNYLTKLEKKTKKFTNYKITIQKHENKIIYPYTLIKGISNQFIALDLLKEKGFDYEIISEALKICKKLKKIKKIKRVKKIKEE